LKALVATASLELGIDIGDVDLTCQLGSPRGIATFLQRVGRSGHGVDALPKGRLFPLSRDELMECTALLDAVQRQELDAIQLVRPAWDVLAQQVVAEISAAEWDTDALFEMLRRAWPYREMPRQRFDQVIRMLADGYTTRRGRRSAYLHLDAVNGRLRGRRGAGLVAMTNGGAIPDQFDYDVVLMPEECPIGTLNEDFAFESLPGDIFQLGNTSYRIVRVETGKVYVEDAKGQPPSIPFWVGEAPGRSDELSFAVSRLREQLNLHLGVDGTGIQAARTWLQTEIGLSPPAAEQLAEYSGLSKAALGNLPTQSNIILERFFDEVGDTHLVIHSPFGSRVNRAWGLAIRKKFCRKFNFELQAAALEDSVILSLGPTHSFPLIEVVGYLRPKSVRDVLIQALLAAPMFPARFRWVATTALAVRRNRNGKKTPPQFQRSDAEDLLAVVFPDQLACAENIEGNREIPDHPLVDQVLADCLHEVMDVEGLESIIGKLCSTTSGPDTIQVTACELATPSPLAQEIITARPYAFLDDAPAEERRTQAIRSRHLFDIEEAAKLATLDPLAIETVCSEAWPDARTADELHDALVLAGFISPDETGSDLTQWSSFFLALTADRRATQLSPPGGRVLWVSAERLGQMLQVLGDDVPMQPEIEPARLGDNSSSAQTTTQEALVEIVRSRLEALGPVTAPALAAPLGLARGTIDQALLALETEGFAIRGLFRTDSADSCEKCFGTREEWCDRRLLARIGRYTIKTLRKQVQPVTGTAFVRFLIHWQGLTGERTEGPEAVRQALLRLQGFAAPALAWESSLLPHRVPDYNPDHLDQLLLAGEFLWLRPLTPVKNVRRNGPVRNTPIMFIERSQISHWLVRVAHTGLQAGTLSGWASLSAPAPRVRDALLSGGASFFSDLVARTGLLRSQVEDALSELVAWGIVTSDSFSGLRTLTTPSGRRPRFSRAGRRRSVAIESSGRWSLVEQVLFPRATETAPNNSNGTRLSDSVTGIEQAAVALLDRYGIVFRSLLAREHRSLPQWRELVRWYRRMEARGEIRGGRFVSGFSGEQFAWPETIEQLRYYRDSALHSEQNKPVIVSAADPLNIQGIITPGEKVPMTEGNRLLYRNGVSVANLVGGHFQWLAEPDPGTEWSARNLLIRNDPQAVPLPDLSCTGS
ncbi:MAG: helicase-related protein, partial [Pseudomonadota bacterium]|nr:helicase-related protein [Pseudomonadota bacterium]